MMTAPQMPQFGYGGMQSAPQVNPYFQYGMPLGGFSNPQSATNYALMHNQAVSSGASRDASLAQAMASVMNNQTNAQAGYDTAYGQAKYGRANLLDQLMQQYQLGQMTNDTNRFGIQTQADTSRYGADRQFEGAMGVAGINADTSRYNTDANRDVAMANQQNQIALANLSNSGNRDIAGINANASMYPHQLKQERFSQVLPLFQSLLGGPGVGSAPAPVTPPPQLTQAPAPSAPAPQAPSPVTPRATLPRQGEPGYQSQYEMPTPGQNSRWAGMLNQQASPTSMESLGQMANQYIRQNRGRARPQRGPGTNTATPQQPARPPWLLGNYPSIG